MPNISLLTFDGEIPLELDDLDPYELELLGLTAPDDPFARFRPPTSAVQAELLSEIEEDGFLTLGQLAALLLEEAQESPPSAPSTLPSTQPSTQPSDIQIDYATWIERHEKRSHEVYPDNRGNPTIGVGFNLNRPGADETVSAVLPGLSRSQLLNGQQLDDSQIDALLNHDIQTALSAARR
jgi:hypothetical protein